MRIHSPRRSRRALVAGVGALLASTLLLTACGGGGNQTPAPGQSGGEPGTPATGGVLVIGAAVSASNQFPPNFNRYGGGDNAPGLDMVYETLFRISSKNGGQIIPVLAESVDHAEDGKTATYHLRKDVTWSDGVPFTSEDVLYTLGTIYNLPNAKPAADEFVWLSAPIETPDDHTVIVHYNDDQRQQETNLALYYPIVPAHVFSGVEDFKAKYAEMVASGSKDQFQFPQDTMDTPVGTGPMKLKKFQSQLVQYEARDDYWGGKIGPSEVQFVPSGTAGNIETQITQGGIDLAEGGNPGVVTGFATASPTNSYTYIADGASRGVAFQMQDPDSPMADVNIRKALRASIDFEAVRDATGLGYTLPNIAGVDPVINESLQTPEFNQPIAINLDQAKADLAAASWTVNANGNLEKDGKEHPLSIQVQNDQATDMVTVPIIVAQWKENLGINVTFDPKPKDVMDGIVQMGEFDMVVLGLNFPSTPWANYTMYDRDNHTIAKRGEKQVYTGNYGRWSWSDDAAKSMAILVSTLNFTENKDQIAAGVQGVQKAFLDDAPIIPYQGGGTGMMSTTINWSALPNVADVDYFPRVGGPGNLNKLLADLKPA